jgi:ribosomal protein L28
MALICAICGKSAGNGVSQRHRRGVAGRRWLKRAEVTKRTFNTNLQIKTVSINGVSEKKKICAKCLKRIKKYGKIYDYSNISVA